MMRKTCICAVLFQLTGAALSIAEASECLAGKVSGIHDIYSPDVRNDMQDQENGKYLLPISIAIDAAHDPFEALSSIQSMVNQCDYGAYIASISSISFYSDSYTELTGITGSANVTLALEPLTEGDEHDNFLAVATHVINSGALRGLGFADLRPLFDQEIISEEEIVWHFQFGRIREECPIIWERYSSLVGPSKLKISVSGKTASYSIVGTDIERHFIDDHPEISVATNTDRDTCELTLLGRAD